MLDIDRLKKARAAANLTQSAAAEKAEISRQRWNDIESGRKANIELGTLDAIALALGVLPADLIAADPPRSERKPGPGRPAAKKPKSKGPR